MPRWVNWAIFGATLVVWGLMALVVAPRLSAQAQGLDIFDMRPFGYSPDQARTFLGALTPQGQAFYLGPYRVFDTVFPILLSITLSLPLQRWSWFWSVPAFLYGVLDLPENWAVARLVRTGAMVDDGSIQLASTVTQAKFAMVALAILLALVAAGRWLWQRWGRS